MVTAYCYYCDKDVEFTVKEIEITSNLKGVEINYTAKVPYCNECKNEIYIAELDDENIKKANDEYRKQSGIITIKEIEDILSTYNISAKTLAKLLGWGQATIERYLKGITPLKLYSDELKKLQNPINMKKLYDLNKDYIGEQSRRKIEIALKNILNSNTKKIVNVFDVAKFFLSKVNVEIGSSITPLKLQKLIYYAQGWHLAFLDKPLFATELEAWKYGPVSPKLWREYQSYNYQEIKKIDFEPSKIFDIEQIQLLNEVYDTYGIFDAIGLMKMTHEDTPWKEIRKTHKESERSSEIIPQEKIREYFKNLKEIFNIQEFKDIKKSLYKYRDILGN